MTLRKPHITVNDLRIGWGTRVLMEHVTFEVERGLVGALEIQVVGADHAIHSTVVRASEPTTGEMPGDLAAVAGRLMRHLASDGLKSVANER
jgi:hypothetical protein